MKFIHTLTPATKDCIWGGVKLRENYNKSSKDKTLAETWELSTHRDGMCLIDGAPADRFLKDHPGFLGSTCPNHDIPIMTKFIDAGLDLSIQVHPDDAYARKHEKDNGKTEMWYIVEAEPDAFIYYGLKEDVSLEKMRSAIENNTIPKLLNRVAIHAGETYLINAGTMHAINKGCLILEVEESSNVTYRVCDYGRMGLDGKPRPLHVEQALQVADQTRCCPDPVTPVGAVICETKYFVTRRHTGASVSFALDPNSFTSLTITKGTAKIQIADESIQIQKGQSLLFPAGTEDVCVTGSFEILTVIVPHN